MRLKVRHASWLRGTLVAVFAPLLVFLAFFLEGQILGADQRTSPDKKEAEPKKDKTAEPFAFADFSGLNSNGRAKESPLDTKAFTGESRFDGNDVYDFNHPLDHTLSGSCETGRTNEIQVQRLGIGGDVHDMNVRGRLMTQLGMDSEMTPRTDASPSRGQWNLADAYRYISEAYGGYRLWFRNDLFGLTFGGGAITNPGRYLVLLPPINGATAASGTLSFA